MKYLIWVLVLAGCSASTNNTSTSTPATIIVGSWTAPYLNNEKQVRAYTADLKYTRTTDTVPTSGSPTVDTGTYIITSTQIVHTVTSTTGTDTCTYTFSSNNTVMNMTCGAVPFIFTKN